MSPRVCIVVVNWNGFQDTLACVRSCLALEGPPFEMVIVDNGSSDSSGQALAATLVAMDCGSRITLLSVAQNLGFAGGSNRGIARARQAGFDFIWLLNNDTLVNPTTLCALVEAAKAHPRAGILGSKILYRDRPDTIWFAGGSVSKRGHHHSVHRGMGEIDRGQYDKTAEVEYITGCSLLVRTVTLPDVPMMCEDYFLYWEDVDFCTRARLAGWQCLYVPESTLMHKAGSTTDREPELKRRYETRGRLMYLWRYDRRGAVEALAALPLELVRYRLSGRRDLISAPLAGLRDFLGRRTGRISP